MKTIEQIREELRNQKHELSKQQHFIDFVAKADQDKWLEKVKANRTQNFIDTLEWVLND